LEDENPTEMSAFEYQKHKAEILNNRGIIDVEV
jgi:hypothetical protein